jgi:hypothetical protein
VVSLPAYPGWRLFACGNVAALQRPPRVIRRKVAGIKNCRECSTISFCINLPRLSTPVVFYVPAEGTPGAIAGGHIPVRRQRAAPTWIWL